MCLPTPDRHQDLRRTIEITALLTIATCGFSACTGPELHVNNPDNHQVFLDGQQISNEIVPYRYYGTSRWETLPRLPEGNAVPEFRLLPQSQTIEIPAPASSWLFPFDLPLELVFRAIDGRQDQTVTVKTIEKTAEQQMGVEISGEKLSQLSERGQQARIRR